MVWFRGTAGDFAQHIGVSLNAVLIMIFAVIAERSAPINFFCGKA